MPRYDLAIIGAGPAGMAAAAQATELGMTVVLLDEQPRAGGQVFRSVGHVSDLRSKILGKDYLRGKALTAKLAHEGITYISGAAVWSIENGFDLSYTCAGRAHSVSARYVLLATGALERPMPVPGWTLPGVMTAGAGQILLKQSGVVARNAVLVGNGPLLYLFAAQMVRAGQPPAALVETDNDYRAAARYLGGAIRGWRYLLKGLGLLAELRRAGVPRYKGVTNVSIFGKNAVEGLSFTEGRQTHRIRCETVFLHHGVVPNTQAARSLDVTHRWSTQQACFHPVLDAWGETDVKGVFVAGDSGGIIGASASEIAGRLAAHRLAELAGFISEHERDHQARPLQVKMAKENAIRPFLGALYPPYAPALNPRDDTIICRCEEVTAGEIRHFARLGCLGPNQAKAFGRPGMGPCQGRFCGLSVTNILAKANGSSANQTGYFRIRPPLKPVTLGELAGIHNQSVDPPQSE